MLSNDIKINSCEASVMSRLFLLFEGQVWLYYLILARAEIPVLPYTTNPYHNDCVQLRVLKIELIKLMLIQVAVALSCARLLMSWDTVTHMAMTGAGMHDLLCFLRLSKLPWRTLPATMSWYGIKGSTVPGDTNKQIMTTAQPGLVPAVLLHCGS